MPAFPADPSQVELLRAVIREAGFTEEHVAETLGGADFVTPRSREFGKALYRTREARPFHVLVRLFLLGVAMPADTVRTALAPLTPESLAVLGLVRITPEGVVPLVTLLPIENVIVAVDPPSRIESGASPDLVNAVTHATICLAHTAIRSHSRKTLDLGTGSGFLALLAADWSDQVYALDINARAVEFARFSARLNGKSNVPSRRRSAATTRSFPR